MTDLKEKIQERLKEIESKLLSNMYKKSKELEKISIRFDTEDETLRDEKYFLQDLLKEK